MLSCCSFCRTLHPTKSKPAGCRQHLRFLCSDKENEAKENLARRLACLVRGVLVVRISYLKTLSGYASPVGDEALEVLYDSGWCRLSVFFAFCDYMPRPGRPASTGPDSLAPPYLKGYESWQRRCPPQGARPFLHPFCGRLDKKDGVWRDATRRLCFGLKKNKEQQI